MTIAFDQSQAEIAKLCRYFETNRKSFFAPGVKEAHVRQSLIDPFFETLGWDVRNSSRIAPQYREVVPEDSLDVEGHQKAPDYTFRVGTTPKFYAEAKKCGVNINVDLGPAYQLRRYAYSAKLDLSILTDFEEFSVYECSSRPKPSDKASHSRIQYFRFEEYPDRWKEIWDIFSRDAVWSGSFDQYISSKRKRGTSEVDTEFLKDIENWREALARNIALRNPSLNVVDLNAAVQRTIDRIIFLRIAEDRGLEPYQQLLKLCEQPNIYKRFISTLCRKADEKYNSGLFHFQKEAGISDLPDNITPKLAIDDKILKPIIQGLYFEFGSPYHFGVLPVEILGTVYERFLGKVIRLTAGHQAKVEEKPEVRKAGGVYYTPSYIVDYIVKNTVGKQVEGKSPAQIAKGKDGQPIRILDMACGSGSFLLGAYQYLLDHCQKWYETNEPEKHTKAVFQDNKGIWRLTITERKRILIAHIFGVDIDRQAVEVTKLSLLIKALEGENDTTLTQQMQLFQERVLPNLSNNIKCGNSLIGPDYFSGTLFPDSEELNRINPFDWSAEFPEAMAAGGFDCVIGNPPYGAAFSEQEAGYFCHKYQLFKGVQDVYAFFIEGGFDILKTDGTFSFIVPSAWLGGPEYTTLRELFLSYGLEKVVLLPFDVFTDAYVDTVIFVASKQKMVKDHFVQTYIYGKREKLTKIELTNADYKSVRQSDWNNAKDRKIILDPSAVRILNKIRQRTSTSFNTIIKIKRGVLFDKEQLTKKKKSLSSYRYFEGNVYRYEINVVANQWIEFGNNMRERPKEFSWFEGERLLLRRLVNRRQRLMAVYSTETFITNKNLYSVLPNVEFPCLKAVLGVLNSRIISYLYLSQITQATKDDFPQVTIKDIFALPFPLIDKEHDSRLTAFVDQMLDLHKRKASATDAAGQERLQRMIDSTDEQIDALVYELYGLTQEEIEIVEAANK